MNKKNEEQPTHISGVYITKFEKAKVQYEITSDPNVLLIEIKELKNAVFHLQRSNREIKEFDPNLTDNDFKLAILENEKIIIAKKKRIEYLESLIHPNKSKESHSESLFL